jgi:hypothetical protein
MDPGWVVVLEKELEALGADVLTAAIPADVAQQLEANQEAAYAALIAKLGAVTTGANQPPGLSPSLAIHSYPVLQKWCGF